METFAVVLNQPEEISVRSVALTPPGPADAVVETSFSGISTGTERLLFQGRMPAFPGMGYPLVPGYETVGTVVEAGPESGLRAGETVFVPGAACFGDIRGLFGGAASRLVVPGRRLTAVDAGLQERGVLLALAATAQHAIASGLPELIIGHGILGRLVARLVLLAGGAPLVWETNQTRADPAGLYPVMQPGDDRRRDYNRICDVSGDPDLLDALIGRLAPGGEIVLAGFYANRLSFAFPTAFMKEARLRVAAQWQPADLQAVRRLIAEGRLSLDRLITHRLPAAAAASAYRTAFEDPACLKMILDWRASA